MPDEYTRTELKEMGVILFALVVIPCILAALILFLLWLWIPLGVLLVAIIIVGALAESIIHGARQRRRDAR